MKTVWFQFATPKRSQLWVPLYSSGSPIARPGQLRNWFPLEIPVNEMLEPEP